MFSLRCKPINTFALSTGAIGLMLLIGASASAQADLKQTLDWVPLHQLTDEQKQQLPLGSCGAYISPLADQDTSVDLSNAPTETSSDKSEIVEKNGTKEITLIGDVIITQGYQKLTADQAVYSEQSGEIIIDGQLTVRQPDLLLLADKGRVNQRANKLVIDNATYVIHSANIRGEGKQLKKDNNIISLTDSRYTSCEPGNNNWALKGSSITINTETNQGSATNVRLEIKGIPVFYWPYLRFPVGDQRQSGFLFPSIASSDNAINVSIPYYFNLAPNYDLTVTPHIMERHGLLLEANGRHLNRYFDTDITIAHLSDDKGAISKSTQTQVNNGSLSLAEATRNKNNDRWLATVQQTGGKNFRWFSEIDYNEVSDNDYLNDFGSSNLNTNSEVSLKQQFKVGYQFNQWRLEVNTQQFQTLSDTITRPFKQLPQLNFDGEYNVNNWNIRLDHEWIRFRHSDTNKPGNTTLTGDRTHLRYTLELDKESDAGFFKPRIQARHLGYQLDSGRLGNGANSAPSITVPQGIIDAGLFFERDGGNYQQTFEPRLFYFHSKQKDQSNLTGVRTNINFDTSETTFSYNQLFSDTRFSGGDRIDDANQLSIGLTTRFINQVSGQEMFSASIGKAIYFDERQVTINGARNTDNNSPIAARLTARFNDQWELTNDIIYDDDNHLIDDATVLLKYRKDRHLFNIGYNFLRNNVSANTIDQAEISLITPFATNNWQLIAHANYDYTNSRDLEQLLGFEYNSCCYRARLAYRRYLDNQFIAGNASLDYDEGLILEFQFFGLGSTGKQLDKLLDDTIDGYEQWQASHK